MSILFEMFTFRGNDVLFLGDFNCDMIQPDKAPKDGRCLMDFLDVYHLKNLVTQSIPSRVTKSTETLIDLISTTNKRRFLQTGVVDTQISDHSLVYSIMRVTLPRLRSRKIAFRSFKNFDRDKFVDDLIAAPFHIYMDIFDDPDDMLYVFESLYNNILDEHSPLKYAHVRGHQVPYMNNQWRSAIRKSNSLWTRFAKERTDANYDLYKVQRNVCTSLRRKAIRKYFHNKAEGSQNPADFWKMYRPFLHSRTGSGQANDILLKEDGNFINEKKALAELFNDYFENILEDANEITEMDYGTDFIEHPCIRAIMHNKEERETFNFDLVNSPQVDLLLSSIIIHQTHYESIHNSL